MKKILLCIFVLSSLQSYSQTWSWAVHDGRSNPDAARHVGSDLSGNSYVVGVFRDTLFNGPTEVVSHGGDDIFIAKYNPSGLLIWAQSGGGAGNDGYSLSSHTDENGNTLVVGSIFNSATFGSLSLAGDNNEIFILKYDMNGVLNFGKTFGGVSNDIATAVTEDAQHNIFMTGYFYNTAHFDNITLSSSGVHDIFLAKLDPAGNTLWAQRAGGSSYDNAAGIITDDAGDCYITGYYTGASSFDTIQLVSTGGDDPVIAKYHGPTGNIIWAASPHGPGIYDIGNKIALDGQGNVYVAGQFDDTLTFGGTQLTGKGVYDVFVAKLDITGNFIWARSFGGLGSDVAYDIITNAAGKSIVCGHFADTASFGGNTLISRGALDLFVMQLDSTGFISWIRTAGSSGDDIAHSLETDNLGYAHVCGSYSDTITFSSNTFTSMGSTDLFVALLDFASGIFSPGDDGVSIKIFPTLVDGGAFTIEIPGEKTSHLSVELTDARGRQVFMQHFRNGIKIYTGQLARGVYLATVRNGQENMGTARLVVQ